MADEKRKKLLEILEKLKNGESVAVNDVCISPYSNSSGLYWHHYIGGRVKCNLTGLKWILHRMAKSKTYDYETVEQYEKRTGKKFRYSLYSEEELSEAACIVRERIIEVLGILGSERLSLISYMIDSYRTCIGNCKPDDDVFWNKIWNSSFANIDRWKYDGNSGFTLLALAERIKKGEI
jgi:hypothetical protein